MGSWKRVVAFLGIAGVLAAIVASGLTASAGMNGPTPASQNVILSNNNPYPATDAGFTAALAAAGTNGTVTIPAGVTLTLTSGHSIFAGGLTLRCEPGAFIRTAVAGADPIDVRASDVAIEECHFQYSSGATDAVILPNSVARIHILRNTFEGYPGGGANTTVGIGNRTNVSLATAVTDVEVTFNTFQDDCGEVVNLQDYVLRADVSHNVFTACATPLNNPLINAQNSDSGTVISDLYVVANQISNAGGGDCVQVQQLTSLAITNVHVDGNTCQLSTIAGHGNGTGYSTAGVTNGTVTHNTFDANGQTFDGGNAPFELVNTINVAETGNECALGTQPGAAACFTAIAYGGNLTGNTIAANKGSLRYTGSSVGPMCMQFYTAGTFPELTRNVIVGNICDLSSSTGPVEGMVFQTTAGTMTSNYAVANTMAGPGGGYNSGGIILANNGGAMSLNVVVENQLFGFTYPYSQSVVSPKSIKGLCTTCVDALTVAYVSGHVP